MNTITIGTRGSKLALWQAEEVARSIRTVSPDYNIKIEIIRTEGDRDQHSSLTKIGGQGIFTKQIEESLLLKKIDIAVHSLKDLPSVMPDDLTLSAVLKRGDVRDILISKAGYTWNNLPLNAKIGSGSIRRRALLKSVRPDINCHDLRGNIETRLKKLDTENLDAIIMAKAAIERLEIKHVNYTELDEKIFIPAVGQGTVGLQIRKDSEDLNKLLEKINHKDTFCCVQSERAFLRELDSGCQYPLGAYATIIDHQVYISGFVSNFNGQKIIRENSITEKKNYINAGTDLARKLIKLGALDLLNDE